MAIKIRYAHISDLDDALEMWWDLHLFHRKNLKAKKDFVYVPDVRKRIRKHFSKTVIPRRDIIVADDKGRLAGFCEFAESSRPPIYANAKIMKIWALYVRPGYRRKGIGKMLLRKVDAIKRTRGLKEAEVSAHVMNADAIAFYRAIGFRKRMVELVK
jgi:ribosomal protein S18 acetylase RimI-like enzyme